MAPPARARSRAPLDRRADVLHAGHHGRQRDEFRIAGRGDQPRQRGLAGARRTPEDHRMQPAALRAPRAAACPAPAGAPGPTNSVEGARPHAVRQRSQQAHADIRPGMQHSIEPRASAPSGGDAPARRQRTLPTTSASKSPTPRGAPRLHRPLRRARSGRRAPSAPAADAAKLPARARCWRTRTPAPRRQPRARSCRESRCRARRAAGIRQVDDDEGEQ